MRVTLIDEKKQTTYPLVRTFLSTIKNSNRICLSLQPASIFQELPNLKNQNYIFKYKKLDKQTKYL